MSQITITAPCCITSRLLPGVRIGNVEISVDYSEQAGDSGRDRYRYYIDSSEFSYTSDDLQSGCQGGSLQSVLTNLLGFLFSCGESFAYQRRTNRDSDNIDLFPANIAEWASQNTDELGMLSDELDGVSDCIVE